MCGKAASEMGLSCLREALSCSLAGKPVELAVLVKYEGRRWECGTCSYSDAGGLDLLYRLSDHMTKTKNGIGDFKHL